MFTYTKFILLSLVVPFSTASMAANDKTFCRLISSDSNWPSLVKWTKLNETLGGRLLHPSIPASSCHQTLGVDSKECTIVTDAWRTFSFHQNDPVSTAWNNMNNDSCVPNLAAPCSGLGYPVYVVNATLVEHVKLAIDFARSNNIRLNVKASGHDYLKRSAAPFSLSIWTRHMTGNFEYHDTFTPTGCKTVINTTAVTADAGSSVNDIYTFLHTYKQTAVDGMGPEVTMGGYLTGAGHSPLSNLFGLGTDQVYEVEMVTPGGQILTANECQNEDLFWAVRGGGGSTFGVLTRVTVRTVPSLPVTVYDLSVTADTASGGFWDSIACILGQFPAISAFRTAAFVYLYPNTSAAGLVGGDKASFQTLFALYDPKNDSELGDIIQDHITQCRKSADSHLNITATGKTFSNFYDMYHTYADDVGAGVDKVVGSRLLPPETLTDPAFQDALIKFAGNAGARLYMVAGEGVWKAKPRGGSNAVNPAWRKALIHAVASQSWTPLDEAERQTVEHNINLVQVEAFRQLTPESGAYLNEAYWNERNFQQAFWGSNYERLAAIKKEVDPTGVFWCHTCVGSEGWTEVGNLLCEKGSA